MSKEKGTALVKFEDKYAVLSTGGGEALEAMKTNLGGDTISPFDLDRVKIPTGAALSFSVPDLDEGEIQMKTVRGVIIYANPRRAKWEGVFAGGNEPPSCMSFNGIEGQGDPGGVCRICPDAQFGSHADGVRPKCKLMYALFLIREGNALPTLFLLPPTSFKVAKSYMTRLAGKSLPYYAVETEIALEKAKSAGGIDYSKATFKAVGRVNPDVLPKVREYHETIKGFLATLDINLDEVREFEGDSKPE